MNIRTAKRQAQIQKWIPIIQKCNQSGLRVIDFCAQEGITKDSYYYWLRKVREAALEAQTSISVVPDTTDTPKLVNITNRPSTLTDEAILINRDSRNFISANDPKSADFNIQLTISVGSAVIGVNKNTPKELLLSVMEVLAHV